MNILIIYGGVSSEREISLLSGINVGEALKRCGHNVTYFDTASGIHTLSDSLKKIDVVFPLLHGTGGEDGVIQRALELEDVYFVGSSSTVSAVCFDKWHTIQQANPNMFPKTELVTLETFNQSALIKSPYVVKPRAEGSSVDTFIIHDPSDFVSTKLDNVFAKYSDELLLEECILGKEITVSILDNNVLPVVEIIPPLGMEFDYTNKYNGATTENCPPKHISTNLQKQAQEIALELHTKMGCRHLSRTDMIIDKNNKIYVLEINTIPGMTKESLYPKSALAVGISIEKLADTLVNLAYSK